MIHSSGIFADVGFFLIKKTLDFVKITPKGLDFPGMGNFLNQENDPK
jgi:hypothetical protein